MIRITSFLLYHAIRLIRRTSAVTYCGAADFMHYREDGPIVTFWHRDFFLMMTFWRLAPLHVVATRSKRGEINGVVLSRLGHRVTLIPEGDPHLYVRCISEVMGRESGPVVIVGDGPLGPAFRVKPTIHKFALRHRRLIIPLEIEVSRFREIRKRWDNLRIPGIFTRAHIVIQSPISCFNEGQQVPFRTFCKKLERALNGIPNECNVE